jgi:hypothetical protein
MKEYRSRFSKISHKDAEAEEYIGKRWKGYLSGQNSLSLSIPRIEEKEE